MKYLCFSPLGIASVEVGVAFGLAFFAFTSPSLATADEPERAETAAFRIEPLTVDANEGIAAGDIDGDGQPDLVAGRLWYSSSDWVGRPVRSIDDWNGYVQSNGDYLFDVNRDGRLDVIAGSFIPSKVFWYENPGPEALRLGQQWPAHLLVDTGNSANEGQIFEDLDGDGRPEWIVNSWKKDVPMVVWRLEPLDPADAGESPAQFQLVPSELGPRGNGHGIGVGDLSGDGRADILVGQGWYEQPSESPWSQSWTFHADWDLHGSLPMLVVDVNDDGRNDLIYGNGHDYGLQWWEHVGVGDDGVIQWKEHPIDHRFSQPHTLAWVDVDEDGQPDLLTGKRYYAHNSNDPGGKEPPCVYYYTLNRETLEFQRHVIDEGRVGTGLQIVAEDLNNDGRTDLAFAGKSGTYLLTAIDKKEDAKQPPRSQQAVR